MDITESVKLEIQEQMPDTDKAYHVKVCGGWYYLPKSQCRIIANYIYVPRWLADKNEIDYLDIDINN